MKLWLAERNVHMGEKRQADMAAKNTDKSEVE